MKTFLKILGAILLYNAAKGPTIKTNNVKVTRNCEPYKVPMNDVNGPYNSI